MTGTYNCCVADYTLSYFCKGLACIEYVLIRGQIVVMISSSVGLRYIFCTSTFCMISCNE